jgi:hypothetical protein
MIGSALDLHLDYSVGTALAFLGTLVGLGVGHLFGDIVLQSDADAAGKGYPSNDRLAAGTHPWTGWSSCLRHCASYLAAQAGALMIVLLVIPVTLPGIAAALALSGSTHAVIDRRWLVQRIVARKGCSTWPQASFWVDQALHWAAMLLAAVVAARITTVTGAAGVTAAGLLLIADALCVERRHRRRVLSRPAPSDRF